MVHPVDTRVGYGPDNCWKDRGRFGLGVDAFLIAVADLTGGAVVATVDLRNLKQLAAYTNGVSIVDLTT